jgi:hypothetical protein
MKRIMILFVAIAISCSADPTSETGVAITKCDDSAKVSACHGMHPSFVAMCYDEGEVGPPPEQANGLTCGAIPEDNLVGGAPWFWFNWYCCDALTCEAGSTQPCSCGEKSGVRACDSTGLHLGSCVCG